MKRKRTKKSENYDSPLLYILVTMYKNLAQEILKCLDYYSKLNLSFVCKDSEFMRPLRITLGVDLKKKLARHLNFKFSQKIPPDYLGESVFEISLLDLALFEEHVRKEENRAQYNQIKFIRVYVGHNYSNADGSIKNSINILSRYFKKLEVLEFVRVNDAISMEIKKDQLEKLKSIKIFSSCDDMTILNIVRLILENPIAEVGLYSKHAKQMQIINKGGKHCSSENIVGNGLIHFIESSSPYISLILIRVHLGINYQ